MSHFLCDHSATHSYKAKFHHARNVSLLILEQASRSRGSDSECVQANTKRPLHSVQTGMTPHSLPVHCHWHQAVSQALEFPSSFILIVLICGVIQIMDCGDALSRLWRRFE